MERYAPHLKDLSCRDVVARCSMLEIRAGRGCGPKKDHVLLKLDHLDRSVFVEKLPGITELAKTYVGVDPEKEPIPVVPTCHYMMGGIPTTKYAQVVTGVGKDTSKVVPGLYAAGECASVSVHGANRLGANSLLDLVVFGRAAGKHIKDHIGTAELAEPTEKDIARAFERYQRLQNSSKGERMETLRAEMRQVMQEDFGVFREAKSMEEGLKKLKSIKEKVANIHLEDKSSVFNTARLEIFEFENLVEVAYATAVAALERTESRGAHSRADFPERDDKNWHKHLNIDTNGNIHTREINMTPVHVDPIALKERAQ